MIWEDLNENLIVPDLEAKVPMKYLKTWRLIYSRGLL